MLAVTEVAGPPGVSVPPVGETVSHVEVLTKLQLKVLLPALVRVKVIELGTNGPPTGPLLTKPLSGVTRRSSGRSNASTTPEVVELSGEVALKPRPRLAKAAHKSSRLAPPLFTRSAWMIASRSCRKVGLAGERFMPSVTSCRMSWLPTAKPYLLISLTRASHNVTHHSSP